MSGLCRLIDFAFQCLAVFLKFVDKLPQFLFPFPFSQLAELSLTDLRIAAEIGSQPFRQSDH